MFFTIFRSTIIFLLSLFLTFYIFINNANAETGIIKIFPHASDGMLRLTDADQLTDWALARDYAGTIDNEPSVTSMDFKARTDDNSGYYRIYRLSIPYDTSVIPSEAIIESASLWLHGDAVGGSNSTGLVVTSHNRTEEVVLVKEDWNITKFGAVAFSRATDPLTTSTYTKFDLSIAGINYINNNGYTVFGLLTPYDFDNVDPGSIKRTTTISASEKFGTTSDPYLEIVYTIEEPPVEEKTIEELVQELIDEVLDEGFSKNIEKSYMAHLKKVIGFVENGQLEAAKKQLDVFARKVEQDYISGDVDLSGRDNFAERVAAIILLIEELDAEGDVRDIPLITQVVSDSPSIVETSSWANASYAGGVADVPGSCGATISQCGCVLSSMSMLGHYYKITEDVEGGDVNPFNMDAWLLANNGYTSEGSIYWAKALQYMGEKVDGVIKTQLTQDSHNETNTKKIDVSLKSEGPAIAFSNVPGGYRHYFVLDDKQEGMYTVTDPFWYNTVTLDDEHDAVGNVQDYNNSFIGAQLFSYSEDPDILSQLVEIHLASPAELLITDSLGRKLGYDPIQDIRYDEIPGGQYDYESSIYSGNETPNAPAHIEKVVRIFDSSSPYYTLEVIGTDTGEYTLSTLTIDEAGVATTTDLITETNIGEIDSYIVATNSSVLDSEVLAELLGFSDQLPEEYREKYLNTLRVVLNQVQKNNITAVESIVAHVIQYLEQHYADELWAGELIDVLGQSF